jgi:hypothetical protein
MKYDEQKLLKKNIDFLNQLDRVGSGSGFVIQWNGSADQDQDQYQNVLRIRTTGT